MKTVNLSLCALLSMGALCQIDAVSLEEAIKNIDVSGFERIKYSLKKPEQNAPTSETIRFSSQLNLISKVADNLRFGFTFAADGNNNAQSAASAAIGGYDINTNKGVYIDRFYFSYSVADLSAAFGRIDVVSPWTERGFNSSRGNGLELTYSGYKGWTLIGSAFLQTYGFDDTNHGRDLGGKNNYYAIGVVRGFKDLGLDVQLWAGAYESKMDAMAFFDIVYENSGFKIKAQANYANLNKNFANSLSFKDDTGIFYGVEASYKSSLFWITASYTKTDKEQPLYTFDGDNWGFIKGGSDLYYTANNRADTAVYSIKGGKWFDKFGFTLGLGFMDSGKEGLDAKVSETYLTLYYKAAKNFDSKITFSTLLDGDSQVSEYKSISAEVYYKF